MRIDWQKTTLGDCFRIRHGYAFEGKYFSDSGPYVLLTPGNFHEEGGFRKKGDKEKYYTGEVPKDYVLNKGDLIVAMTEQGEGLLGSSAIIPDSEKFLHNQRLGLIADLDERKIDKGFLYYLFNTRGVRHQIRASASGVKVRHTSPTRIYEVKVDLPPVSSQRKIASILSAYDDLIENNKRRIKILEEMAQAIYRKWFVEFRAPGVELRKATPEERKLTGKDVFPKAWEVKPLNAVVSEIIDYRGKTPKKLGGDWSDEGILALSALNVKQGRLVSLDKAKFVSEQLYARWMKTELKQGDILLTSEAPLGELYYLAKQKRYCLSQRLFSIRANETILTSELLFFVLSSPSIQSEIHSRATGATVSGIRQSQLRMVPVVVPDERFQKKVSPTFREHLVLIDNLQTKNDNFRRTRDLLLPKLISGEVEVEGIEVAS